MFTQVSKNRTYSETILLYFVEIDSEVIISAFFLKQCIFGIFASVLESNSLLGPRAVSLNDYFPFQAILFICLATLSQAKPGGLYGGYHASPVSYTYAAASPVVKSVSYSAAPIYHPPAAPAVISAPAPVYAQAAPVYAQAAPAPAVVAAPAPNYIAAPAPAPIAYAAPARIAYAAPAPAPVAVAAPAPIAVAAPAPAPIAYAAPAPVAVAAPAPIAVAAPAPIAVAAPKYYAAPAPAPAIIHAAAPVVQAAPIVKQVVAAAPVVKAIVPEPYDPNPQYSFSYGVTDPHTGDSKHATESLINGVVHGSYSVAEPDGSIRKVTYTADKINGFNAVVEKQGGAIAVKAVAPAAIVKAAPVAVVKAAPVAVAAPVQPVYHAAPVAHIAPAISSYVKAYSPSVGYHH